MRPPAQSRTVYAAILNAVSFEAFLALSVIAKELINLITLAPFIFNEYLNDWVENDRQRTLVEFWNPKLCCSGPAPSIQISSPHTESSFHTRHDCNFAAGNLFGMVYGNGYSRS